MPQKLHTNEKKCSTRQRKKLRNIENAQKANKFCTHLGRRRTEKSINLFGLTKASMLGGQSKKHASTQRIEEKPINSFTILRNSCFSSSYLIGHQQDDFRSGGDHSLVYYTCSTWQPALSMADCCEGGEEEKHEH